MISCARGRNEFSTSARNIDVYTRITMYKIGPLQTPCPWIFIEKLLVWTEIFHDIIDVMNCSDLIWSAQACSVCFIIMPITPLPDTMCFCWPWQRRDQWSNGCSRTMNISIKIPRSANWLHLSSSSPGHPNKAEPAFAVVKHHLYKSAAQAA